MHIEHIETEKIPRHPEFTSIVSVSNPGKIHFIAGRTSTENGVPVHPRNMLAQYRQVLKLLSYELEQIGATWAQVVYYRISATDVDAWLAATKEPDIAGVYDREHMPAGTLVGVTRLAHPDFMVEMDLIAVTE